MPIGFATAPQNGDALVRSSLNSVAARDRSLATSLANVPALNVAPPHAVYDLRADSLARGEGLAAARQTSFRYLVAAAGGASIAAAEVHSGPDNVANLLANLNYGPYVQATTRALAKIQDLPEVQKGNYEGRLLRCSAIYLVALWLKAEAGGADILYPLDPAPAGLQAEQPYSVEAFLAIVVPLAKQRTGSGESTLVP
jgi:hypothetical protein